MKEVGSLLLGIRLGEAVMIGDVEITPIEFRGRLQVSILIKAPKDIPIERKIPRGTKGRNEVQGNSLPVFG